MRVPRFWFFEVPWDKEFLRIFSIRSTGSLFWVLAFSARGSRDLPEFSSIENYAIFDSGEMLNKKHTL
jgi:hypothetical protein